MKYFYTYKVEDRFWVYDRYSNKITEIDELTYKIFSTYNQHKFDIKEVIHYFQDLANKNELVMKTNEIKHFQNKYNMFQPFDFDKCSMPITDKELEVKYNNEAHQFVFNLTDDCNLRCKYCKFGGSYIGIKEHQQRTMSYDIIDAGIDLIKKYYKNKEKLNISFYGGEPLMEFKKIEYIVNKTKCLYNNVGFSFTTNGVFLNKNIIEFLIKHNFILMISLDGAKKNHDKNRITKNGKGTFDIISKRIKKIKEINIDYYHNNVGFVVTIAPPYNLIELINYFEKNTHITQPFFVSTVDPFGTTYFDNFNMKIQNKRLSEQYQELIDEYINLKIKNIYNNRVKIIGDFLGVSLLDLDDRPLFPLESTQIKPNGACLPGLKSLFINTDGNLGMCEKVHEQITIGNVKDGIDIKKIKELNDEYYNVVDKVCLNCWAYRLCKSCQVDSVENGRFTIERKKNACKIKKRAIISDIKVYTQIKMNNSDAFKRLP